MILNITVPELGESVTEATVAKWFKAPGDTVALDEPLVELETDKIALEINAASAGVLAEILVPEGEDVEVGTVLGHLNEGKGAAAPSSTPSEMPRPEITQPAVDDAAVLSPAVRKLIEENGLDPSAIIGSGRDGRILKGDVLDLLQVSTTEPPASTPKPIAPVAPSEASPKSPEAAREERVPMSRLRQRVAERLKMAQDTAAMLTTFNEVDMTKVMAARSKYRDAFEQKHGVRLGFMSFFVKAVVTALQEIPSVNAEIDGAEIVYNLELEDFVPSTVAHVEYKLATLDHNSFGVGSFHFSDTGIAETVEGTGNVRFVHEMSVPSVHYIQFIKPVCDPSNPCDAGYSCWSVSGGTSGYCIPVATPQ